MGRTTQSPPEYTAHKNTTKVVLIDWVNDAINAGNVTFNTYQQKLDFQNLIQQVHQSINASNWANVVTQAAQLNGLTTNIQGATTRALVGSLCECLETIYTDDEFMLLDNADAQTFQDALATGNPDAIVCAWGIEVHMFLKEITVPFGDGGSITIVQCTRIRWVPFPDKD